MKTRFYVYLVQCADGSYYTGYTQDLDRRVTAHNAGKGARYTRSRLPVELVYFEEYKSLSAALKRECRIKCLSHAAKETLVNPEAEN